MNNQFATRRLLEEFDEFESLRNMLRELGASDDIVEVLVNAVAKGRIEPSKAVEIIKATAMHEDGMGGGSTTGGGVTNGAAFTPGNGEQYAMGSKKISRKKLGESESAVGQHFDLDVKSERGDGSIQRYQLKNVKLVNANERVFEKPDGTTVVLSPSDKYTATKVGDLDEDAPRLAGEPSKTDRGGARNLSAYTKDRFTKAPSAEEAAKSIKGVDVKDLWGKKALEESYFKFRNETRTRGKSEQFHEAVKIINKKLDEVNKLLEFTGTLKTELSESEDTFEVKTYTKKSMDKVRGKVIEAYQKLKQL
jgi:hypothetical protein